MLRWTKRRKLRVPLFFVIICLILLFLHGFGFLEGGRSSLETSLAEADGNIDSAVGPRGIPSSVYVLPNSNTVIVNPQSPCCEGNGSKVFVLVMVITPPANSNARNVIRSGLKFHLKDYNGEFSRNLKPSLKTSSLLFFSGLPKTTLDRRLLFNEAKLHGDIIIDDIEESYMNLTLKSMRMLKWTHLNCHEAEFTVKIDDNVHLNLKRLLNALESLSGLSAGLNLIGGKKDHSAVPDRDPTSGKWFTPRHLWADEVFPDFVAGFLYVLGKEARRKIYAEALTHPLFHLEHVFLTGIIPFKLSGMKITDFSLISKYWSSLTNLVTTSCDIQENYYGVHFIFKGYNYLDCWKEFNDMDFVCDHWPLITRCWFN